MSIIRIIDGYISCTTVQIKCLEFPLPCSENSLHNHLTSTAYFYKSQYALINHLPPVGTSFHSGSVWWFEQFTDNRFQRCFFTNSRREPIRAHRPCRQRQLSLHPEHHYGSQGRNGRIPLLRTRTFSRTR